MTSTVMQERLVLGKWERLLAGSQDSKREKYFFEVLLDVILTPI